MVSVSNAADHKHTYDHGLIETGLISGPDRFQFRPILSEKIFWKSNEFQNSLELHLINR